MNTEFFLFLAIVLCALIAFIGHIRLQVVRQRAEYSADFFYVIDELNNQDDLSEEAMKLIVALLRVLGKSGSIYGFAKFVGQQKFYGEPSHSTDWFDTLPQFQQGRLLRATILGLSIMAYQSAPVAIVLESGRLFRHHAKRLTGGLDFAKYARKMRDFAQTSFTSSNMACTT